MNVQALGELFQGREAAAADILRSAWMLANENGLDRLAMASGHNLSELLLVTDAAAEAADVTAQLITAASGGPDLRRTAALSNFGAAKLLLGEPAESLAALRSALSTIVNKGWINEGLDVLLRLAAALADTDPGDARSAFLFGVWVAVRKELGATTAEPVAERLVTTLEELLSLCRRSPGSTSSRCRRIPSGNRSVDGVGLRGGEVYSTPWASNSYGSSGRQGRLRPRRNHDHEPEPGPDNLATDRLASTGEDHPYDCDHVPGFGWDASGVTEPRPESGRHFRERFRMADEVLRGATVPARPDITPETFDRAHGSTANELMWRLSRLAYGADYPEQVQPWGMTTWWTLGRLVAGLRIGPGQTILDLACGRGGVGLWLARATGAKLIGVDFSPVAVVSAAARAAEFVPDGRAGFLVGDLSATGVGAASVDGAFCADAVFFATDRVAVFAEMSRILRPGARFLFTADESNDERPSAVPDWTPLIEAGGLVVEEREQIPRWREGLRGMYDTWMTHIDEVRETLGDESADDLIDEATHVGPTLSHRTGIIYTTRRP